MLDRIDGLHHITSLARDAAANNAFFTGLLGLRRVKKTVNFDAPDVYHLYFGDAVGSPGTVMTYFPFPRAGRGTRGAGEAGRVSFSVPAGSLDAWQRRLSEAGVAGLRRGESFGAETLDFEGPDGEALALVEAEDARTPWREGPVSGEIAIRGFHATRLVLREAEGIEALLRFMGFAEDGREGAVSRHALPGGGPGRIVEIETRPDAPPARQGAGSVHHVAFSVADRAAQAAVRDALVAEGYDITPPIDRDYFWAVYFRAPGGVLFEVATAEPGFDRDEDVAHLGEALKLPAQHEHLRPALERHLAPVDP